ncbi:ABC transporter permease [Lactococcus garvieae]|uniref:ABC transporter permease n=1 Tax=Lactococcus garvieae TaxID=1363 RepID=UPI0018D74844|nr:ABC transporter permease [Lactococcus garvieae]QPS71567.1 ABC transporter permease [Lactococcus garvieae]
MDKPLNKTIQLLGALLKRDWLKLSLWIIAVLAFAASGVGKFELMMQTDSQRETMFNVFRGPAMTALFGPMTVNQGPDFTAAAAYGTTMPLITAITFAIVSVIYVINRTRKEEEDGITEVFRSFQVGKLASTTAVVIELFFLHVLLSLILAASIQLQNVTGMADFSVNLLFASSIATQGFLWGMIALVFAQIFSESGSAKGATFGILGMLYLIRMWTDTQNVNLGYWNPLSWSYLTAPYIDNHWLPILLAVVLSFFLLIIAYILEIRRDVNAGYIPEAKGKERAPKSLLSFTGLTLRQQRTASMGWLFGLFVLGITYGSMINQIGGFVESSPTISKLFNIDPNLANEASQAASKAMVESFMSTIFMICAVMVSCFAVTSLSRMVSEERKNRQEQLYAFSLSRYKVYANYMIISWILGALAQFAVVIGIYIAQAGNEEALSFLKVAQAGMAWTVGIFFVLGLLGLLMAFVPRVSSLIWAYLGFTFFMSYIGNLLDLPAWINNLNVFHHISRLPVETMDWNNFMLILALALIFAVMGMLAYRQRDLIGD